MSPGPKLSFFFYYFTVPVPYILGAQTRAMCPLVLWPRYPLGFPEVARVATVLAFLGGRQSTQQISGQTISLNWALLPNLVGRKEIPGGQMDGSPTPTYTLISPTSWGGNCFELLSARHTAQHRTPPEPLGLDWGFPTDP